MDFLGWIHFPDHRVLREPPFRAPHQTISAVALVGGGSEPRPGEISLAHRGVLFLDELPEFQRGALEALRQPLEEGYLTVGRARRNVVFPARFTLVAAMNPCPCGYYGDPVKECSCTAYEVIKYQKRISGPILDRIDLQIKVGRVEIGLEEDKEKNYSEDVKKKIAAAKEMQRRRFSGNGTLFSKPAKSNADMTSREIKELAQLDATARAFVATIEGAHLSPRAYYRIVKVARTIADLDGREEIAAEHLAEAFSYRMREMS